MKRIFFMLFLFIFPSTLISKPVEIYVQYVNEQGIEDFAHLLSEKDWKGAIRIVAKDDFFHGDELTVEEYAIRLWDEGSIMRNYEPYLVQKGDSVTDLLLNVVKELVEDKRMSRQKGTSLTKSVLLLVKVKGRTQPIPFSVSIFDETIKPCRFNSECLVRLADGRLFQNRFGKSIHRDSLLRFEELCYFVNDAVKKEKIGLAVKAFSITYFDNNGNSRLLRSESSSFSDKMLDFFRKVPNGKTFYITNITLKDTSSVALPTNPCIMELKVK